jgi:polysaccharide pyruvyl transferase WcaK-like protein
MFAVQKGIPVLSLSYLPKNMNFMKAVGLEEYVTASIAPGEILGIVNKIQTNQHSIREKMNEYTKEATCNIQNDVINILNLVK